MSRPKSANIVTISKSVSLVPARTLDVVLGVRVMRRAILRSAIGARPKFQRSMSMDACTSIDAISILIWYVAPKQSFIQYGQGLLPPHTPVWGMSGISYVD